MFIVNSSLAPALILAAAAGLIVPAMASAQHAADPGKTRVIVSTESNASGPRRVCLTPYARGEAVIAGSFLRRTCLSKQQWALRGYRVVES
ncbi:hypothetical protein G4G27_02840 [Sphingomonas sp. So64.6b]|uniref:hypothetical protein n=1 Tax=Sphingomonas sp. So64.6b TaxID=2997354 RepID=UPI0015FF1DAE|nr:hypothetical protein [Sphingomonas sp. So64.6b]QNA83067.1 hypothetical protein G4G27_02840 [Sphingomonas sp. So64.6b]